MAILVDYVGVHADEPEAGFTPPASEWCHMVSDSSLLELTLFCVTLGLLNSRIRVAPATTATHVNLTAAERATAISLGATEVSGKACYARNFAAPNRFGVF